jgi:serralysin
MPTITETTDAAAGIGTTYTLASGAVAQATLTAGDHDWFRVSLVAGQTYTFAEVGTGVNNLNDSLLTLRNSAGAFIVKNDDGLPNRNSLITYTATTTGTYYLDAASFSTTGTGQYAISVTDGSRASFDLTMGAGVLNTDYSWSAAGTAANVTFGFRITAGTAADTNTTSTFSVCTAAEMSAIRSILQTWSDVANITFTDINPTGFTDSASILFGNYAFNDGGGAYAQSPGSTAATSGDGDVWL